MKITIIDGYTNAVTQMTYQEFADKYGDAKLKEVRDAPANSMHYDKCVWLEFMLTAYDAEFWQCATETSNRLGVRKVGEPCSYGDAIAACSAWNYRGIDPWRALYAYPVWNK